MVLILSGTLNVQGDVTQSNNYANGGGTGTINFNGTGTQYFNGNTSALGWFGNIKINKPSGTLYLKKLIVLNGKWEYIAGTVDASTYASTLCFPTGAASNMILGTQTLNKIALSTNGGYGNILTVNTGDTLTVDSLISTAGTAITGFAGIINLTGDITVNNTSSAIATGGGGTIIINGTSNQTITGTTNIAEGRLCTISINKPSGTLTLKNHVTIGGNWNYIQGALDVSTYSSTVVFPYAAARTISGKHALYNVSFQALSGNSINSIASLDTLTVTGTLKTEGASIVTINTGVINVQGDITTNNTLNGVSETGGTATIRIAGSGTQTITGASVLGRGRLCNIKIDKQAGTLVLKNFINSGGSWTYLQGTIDASTYTSTVGFCFSSGRTISGNHSLYNVSFNATSASTSTIALNDTLTVLGLLTTDGSQPNSINSGTINLKGDLTINNTSTSAAVGTATICFTGTGDKTITGHTTALAGRLCNVKINKSSGTVFLKNNVTLGNASDWKLLSGSVDGVTYSSTLIFSRGTRRIQGTQNLYNLSLNADVSVSSDSIYSSDTLKVHGLLKLEGTTLSIYGGTINALGDITVTTTSSGVTYSTGLINICGSGGQTFTGSGLAGTGRLCNVRIDKSSGTLYLLSLITVSGSWTYVRGTVNAGTSTVYSYGAYMAPSVTCKGSSANMSFNHFTVLGNGTTTLSGNLYASGNVTMASGGILNGNGKFIYVGRNWDNIGGFTYANTHVVLNGSSDQYITRASGPITFDTLTIDKRTNEVLLSKPVIVNKKLTLTSGAIGTTATNLLSMPDNATVSGSSDRSFVCGPMKKTGNDAFTFPLGDTLLVSGKYHPLSITAPSVATDAFTSQYYGSTQTAGATVVDSIEISICEYWTIARTTGSSSIKTTLGWNGNNSVTVDSTDMVVAGWDGAASKWKSLENNGATITNDSVGSVLALLTPAWSGTTAIPITIGRKKAISITELVVEPYCVGTDTLGNINVTVAYGSPPFTYAWSNASTTQDISSLTANTYSLTVTDRKARTFLKSYTLKNCVAWQTLPTTLTSDSVGTIHKVNGLDDWEDATLQSTLIMDSIETGRWIEFTVGDTVSSFFLGFASVRADSLADEVNMVAALEGKNLVLIQTDNDGFYSKEVIDAVKVGDVIRIELDDTQGTLYYKNSALMYTGKLLSNVRLQVMANVFGVTNAIKTIRCSSNN